MTDLFDTVREALDDQIESKHGFAALASIEERLRKAEVDRDNAAAALERMRLELVRVDEMASRYSQSADAVSEDRAKWMERYAELEAALREIADMDYRVNRSPEQDIARRALGGQE